MPIRSFLDLDVYQRSYKAAIIVNKEIVLRLPDNEKYDLKDQASRASKAIPAIIAEGYARKHHKKDWQKYIDDAIGEANEMIVHLSLTKDLYSHYVNIKIVEELIKTYDIIGKQLYKLGKSWNGEKSQSSPSSSPPRPNSLPTSRLSSSLGAIAPIALSINGTPIPVPRDLEPLNNMPDPISRISSVGITWLLILGIVLALIFILISAVQWIASEGDKQKLQAARNRLTFSIIGLAVILLAFFIVNFIGGLLSVKLFN